MIMNHEGNDDYRSLISEYNNDIKHTKGNNLMKKRHFLVLMIIMMITLLAGCGDLNMKHKNEDKTTTTVTAQGSMALARCPKFEMDSSYGIRMYFNGITQFYIWILYGEELKQHLEMEPIAESSNLTVYVDPEDDFPYHYVMDLEGTDDSYILFRSFEAPDASHTLATDFDGMLTYTVNGTETVPDVKGLKVLRDFAHPGSDDLNDPKPGDVSEGEPDDIPAANTDPEGADGASDEDFSDYNYLLSQYFYTLQLPLDDFGEASGELGYYWLADFRYDVEYLGKPATKLAGFNCHDYSGDGIPELIIASFPLDEEWSVHTEIKTIYTMTGEEEYHLAVEGWGRNRQYLLNTGEFYNEGSSGATESCFGTYKLSSDGTEVVWNDFYFSTYNGISGNVEYYHNTTGIWDVAASEKQDMTEDQFWDLQKSYQDRIVDLELYPIQSMQGICGAMGGCLVYAMLEEDCPYDTANLKEYDISTDDSPLVIVLEAYDDVYDLALCDIEWGEDRGGEQDFTLNPIKKIGDLPYGKAVKVIASFPGDMSALYYTFTDTFGNIHAYCVTMSGYDGSLVIDPWF